MSYIRGLSNPEGLYIWGDEEKVTVTKGSETIGYIPIPIFNGLIRKYIRGYCEDCKYKGAEIKEVLVKNDIELPDEEFDKDPSVANFKMKLSYDNWSVIMWYVTWYYIARSNYKSKK
jgi:hypothetical protein